jgi:CheY-like chemotaxis protein
MDGNELKQTQHNVESTEKHLEWVAKVRRSDQLLIRMNHEIRSAVNMILGLTDVIRESELSPQLGNSVGVARSSAERLLKESSEIIDLARAELGTLQLSSISFNLADTLQQAMDIMAILASCKRVRIKCHISPLAPIVVVGDPGRLSQILITLVRAAIDRLEQGEVWVNVATQSDASSSIKFSISDNGRRIPPEKTRDMFDFKLDHETAPQDVTELPLVLARHLARMMDGDLWAAAEPEVGAVLHFTANLPPAPVADALQLIKGKSNLRTDRRPLKILVVDDSADTILLIRAFLRDAPWGIESAENGRAALEMAVKRTYDLILMDLDMPEMNGYTATRQIRISECLNEMRAVPIVALTAHNEAEAASKSIEAGCTAHVTKPIRKTVLIETIQRYAADKSLAEAHGGL